MDNFPFPVDEGKHSDGRDIIQPGPKQTVKNGRSGRGEGSNGKSSEFPFL